MGIDVKATDEDRERKFGIPWGLLHVANKSIELSWFKGHTNVNEPYSFRTKCHKEFIVFNDFAGRKMKKEHTNRMAKFIVTIKLYIFSLFTSKIFCIFYYNFGFKNIKMFSFSLVLYTLCMFRTWWQYESFTFYWYIISSFTNLLGVDICKMWCFRKIWNKWNYTCICMEKKWNERNLTLIVTLYATPTTTIHN